MKPLKIILKIFAAPFAVFAVHLTLVIFFDIYKRFPRLDILFHILGGLAISYFFILILKYFQNIDMLPEMRPVFEIIFVASLVCAAIVVWELLEFAMDYFFRINAQVSLTNTMVDMFFSASSGLVMACFVKKITFKNTLREKN